MAGCSDGRLTAILSALFIFELLLSIVVVALDITFLANIGNSATFAYKQLLDASISLSAIMSAVMVFGLFYFIAVVFKILFMFPFFVKTITSDQKSVMILCLVQTITLLLTETIRQPLYIKLITCINNYYQDILRARSILAIIMMVVTLASTAVYIINNKFDEYKLIQKVLAVLAYITCILIPIAVIAMNIAAFAVLTPGDTKPVFPSDIQLGFFNKTDVLNIQNGQYTKDSFYSNRIVANLESVINSQYKRYAYTKCSYGRRSSSCYSYYYRITFATIDCSDSQNKVVFYDDCVNATKLYFRIEYLDDKSSYPSYYCGKESTSAFCEIGCNSALKYTMLMVQESNNTLIYPWSNYSTCSAQPSVSIPVDLTINACSSSSRLTFDYIIYILSLVLCFSRLS